MHKGIRVGECSVGLAHMLPDPAFGVSIYAPGGDKPLVYGVLPRKTQEIGGIRYDV